MASIVVIGGGIGGLSAALLLAGDGHEVTLLERDPAPPPAVEPWYRATLSFDRNRLGEIEAQIAGVPYETDDVGWGVGKAMAAASDDPDVLRAFAEIAGLLATAEEIMARPGFFDRVIELSARPTDPAPGPTRQELLALVQSA